jgi:hypothetical protein
MTEVTTSTENAGHKLFMENFFSPDDYLLTNIINSCDIAGPNQEGMPTDFGKKLEMKQGDIKTNAKAVKRQQNGNMLTNMHHAAADGEFCYDYGSTLKSAIVKTITDIWDI